MERIFRQFSTYDSVPALIYDAFIEFLTLYLPFGIRFLAWDHLYLIRCSPRFFPWVFYGRSLEHFKCDVDGAQHSIPDSLNPVYYTGIKQDFNAHGIIREND